MSIWYLLVNTLFSTMSSLLVYVFLKVNFDFNCSRNRLLVFLALFGFINGVMSTAWSQFVNLPSEFQSFKPVILLLLSIQTIRFVLKIDWAKTVLSFFMVMVAMGLGNYLTPLLFSILGYDITAETISNNINLYFFVNISIFLISVLFTFTTPHLSKLRKIKNLKPVSFLFGVVFLMMAINMSTHFVEHFNLMSFALVLISSLAFALIALIYVNKYQRNEELSEEQRQQHFYNESLSKTLQELRYFKHDINNHLSVLRVMIKNKEYTEADKYLSEISDQQFINTTNTAIYNIKNVALFSLISSKIDKAKNANVVFNLKTIGTIDSIPGLKVSELCEILGIYLDNALEAAEVSTDKVIEMTVIEYLDSIDIKISNSCLQMPIMSKLKIDGYSTKGTDRGHGLAIVEKILGKYKYIINIMTFDEIVMHFNQELKIKKA